MSANDMTLNKIYFKSLFDVKHAYCEIRTNDVVGINNISSVVNGSGFGTSSTNSMLMMENGENIIGVRFAALNWYNSELSDIQQNNKFTNDAYCDVDIVMINKEKYQSIGRINIRINSSGQPIAQQSDVIVKEVNGFDVMPGHINNIAYEPEFYPKGIKLYEFQRKVNVTGLPAWAWTNAQPYTDKPDQRHLLQETYEKIWRIMAGKEISQLKSVMGTSLNAWTYAANSTADSVFDDHDFAKKFARSDFKMQPVNWDDYDIVVMNNGKMVRLVNKSNPIFSPLTQWYDNDMFFYAPILSLVNNQFIIVL